MLGTNATVSSKQLPLSGVNSNQKEHMHIHGALIIRCELRVQGTLVEFDFKYHSAAAAACST